MRRWQVIDSVSIHPRRNLFGLDRRVAWRTFHQIQSPSQEGTFLYLRMFETCRNLYRRRLVSIFMSTTSSVYVFSIYDSYVRLIRRSLILDAAHSLVRALIHSRLDYCNSIMAGIQKHQLDRLQSVLKAAARFVLRLSSGAQWHYFWAHEKLIHFMRARWM